jgi:hypothetical protein
MGVAHGENDHFTYDITSKLKTKFLGNSVEVYPIGRYFIELQLFLLICVLKSFAKLMG